VAALTLTLESPGLETIGTLSPLRRPENRACAVDEKHPKVRIAALGDGTEPTDKSARVLPGSEPEEAREVATGGEAVDVADKGHESGGGEEADAGDRAQTPDDGILRCEGFDLVNDVADAGVEVEDFSGGFTESRPQGGRDRALRIFDERPHGRDDPRGTLGDEDAYLPKNSASGIDAGGAIGDIGGAVAVKRGHDLLVDGFDGHGMDVFVAEGFEKSFRICAIGLVTHGVGADGMWREQNDRVTEAPELSGPVMSRTAGLEENGGRLALGEEELEPRPGEAIVLAHVARVGGDGDFKNRFREIDGYGRMVHGWTPPFVIGLEPECGLAQYDAEHAAGGVHSITYSYWPLPSRRCRATGAPARRGGARVRS